MFEMIARNCAGPPACLTLDQDFNRSSLELPTRHTLEVRSDDVTLSQVITRLEVATSVRRVLSHDHAKTSLPQRALCPDEQHHGLPQHAYTLYSSLFPHGFPQSPEHHTRPSLFSLSPHTHMTLDALYMLLNGPLKSTAQRYATPTHQGESALLPADPL
jgi:hypothetical protein